eukprot:Hpha_TRINITY_DN30460_c0_g1::TRINITY_DN30460_c0_g1_i1::g.167960::m.167960
MEIPYIQAPRSPLSPGRVSVSSATFNVDTAMLAARRGSGPIPETPTSSGSYSVATTPPGDKYSISMPPGEVEKRSKAELLLNYGGGAELVERLYNAITAPALPSRRSRRREGSPGGSPSCSPAGSAAGSPRRSGSPRRQQGAHSPSPMSPRRRGVRERRTRAAGGMQGRGEGSSSEEPFPEMPTTQALMAAPTPSHPQIVVADSGDPAVVDPSYTELLGGLPAGMSSLSNLAFLAGTRRSSGWGRQGGEVSCADDSDYEERIGSIVEQMNRPTARPSSWLSKVQSEAMELGRRLEESQAESLRLRARLQATEGRLREKEEECKATEVELEHQRRETERYAERSQAVEEDLRQEQIRTAALEAELRGMKSELEASARRGAELASAAQATQDVRERERKVEESLQVMRTELASHAQILDDAAVEQREREAERLKRVAAEAVVEELQGQVRSREAALEEAQERLQEMAKLNRQLQAAKREAAEVSERAQRVQVRRDEEALVLELKAREAVARAAEVSALLDVERNRGSRAEAALRRAELRCRGSVAVNVPPPRFFSQEPLRLGERAPSLPSSVSPPRHDRGFSVA